MQGVHVCADCTVLFMDFVLHTKAGHSSVKRVAQLVVGMASITHAWNRNKLLTRLGGLFGHSRTFIDRG